MTCTDTENCTRCRFLVMRPAAQAALADALRAMAPEQPWLRAIGAES